LIEPKHPTLFIRLVAKREQNAETRRAQRNAELEPMRLNQFGRHAIGLGMVFSARLCGLYGSAFGSYPLFTFCNQPDKQASNIQK